MKLSTAVAVLSTALSANAQTTTVSAPFNLVAFSEFGPFNDQPLGTCHSGAGIESICLLGNSTAVFHLNQTVYSTGSSQGPAGDSTTGVLTWSLNVENGGADDQAMGLYPQISTNVAEAVFGLAPTTQVAFDNKNYLNLLSPYNDAVTPPTFNTSTAYYRWQICQTNFEGYIYTTLNWVYGSEKAQNPSCHPVSVQRVFAPAPAPTYN